MGQAQINVRTRACSRTSIARTKQAALTHNVRGKELIFTEYVVCRLYAVAEREHTRAFEIENCSNIIGNQSMTIYIGLGHG